MKHIKTGTKRREFEMLLSTRNVQAAMMTLRPGGTSDDEPSNEHPRSEQWVFVIAGSGEAVVGQRGSRLRRVKLAENSLLLIEKGELHQIRNTGRKHFRTINFYAPPAYNEDGEPAGWLGRLVGTTS
jgi:mannose-6-phosphate isomerase-like protein (cupin superfamily)